MNPQTHWPLGGMTVALAILITSARAQQPDRSQQMIRRFDRNGDGKVDRNELPERMRQAFDRVDADHDGFITVEEDRAFRMGRNRRQPGTQGTAPGEADFFTRLDRNGDGKLTRDELPPPIRARFDELDRNHDGAISQDEAQAFRRGAARHRNNQRRRQAPSIPPTHADVAYGPHEKQRFDIWVVKAPTPAPLVLFIHGGGFRGGDKRGANGALVDKLLGAGFAVASLNYRLTDVGPFPMQMHDCARALQFIRFHAKDYNIDPKRVGSSGGSAGAGISEWLAFHDDLADPESDDPAARQSTRLTCIAPFAAQTSYDPRFILKLFDTDDVESAFFAFYGMKTPEDVNNPKFWPLFEEASPLHHLTADDPPVFVYYSQANTELPPNPPGRQYIHHPKFGFVLKKKMDELGIPCTLRLKEESPRLPVDEIVAFYRRYLQPVAPPKP